MEVKILVIHFEKLSKALDVYNANRIETEQIEFCDVIGDLENPLDPVEVLTLITELYEEANGYI